MDKDILSIEPLSKDEMGKLKGGFSIHSIIGQTGYNTTNGNCLGGGWGDTNTNCTGTCTNCSIDSDTDIRGNGSGISTKPIGQ